MPLRIAAATEDLHSSLKSAIGVAAGLEIDGIRLNTRAELNVNRSSDSALRQTLLYVRERQMEVAGLYCPTRHALYDEAYIEERLDVVRKSMSLVRRLGTTELLIRVGPIPDANDCGELPDQSAAVDAQQENPFSFAAPGRPAAVTPARKFAMLCEILNDLAQHGNHVGCVLCLLLTAYDCSLLQTLTDRVKSGPLRFVFDPATAVMTGTDPVGAYRDLYRHVGYIRLRDAIRNADGAGVEVAVGQGVVDWMELVPTLVESDYRGWLCVERSGGDRRLADVRHGVSELKTLIPQSGD